MKTLVIFGTRPEAIKMAPVIQALRQADGIETRVCVTAQHRQMLDQVLQLFDIRPDHDLNLMQPGQDLTDITANVLHGLRPVLAAERPDLVLVHGDTTTTLAGALAAYYQRIPVGHVEAGLRTGNIHAPWPEEMNRRIAGAITSFHFAPTARARDNLQREGVGEERIHVTGNTVIDALLAVVDKVRANPELQAQFRFLDPARRTVVVTGHRRENFGDGFQRICRALGRLAERSDVQIVYPVHLNPNVLGPVREALGQRDNVHLIEPLDYLPFVALMDRADLIITDSGGVQEEAPSLGKPVLVMRETTERPEAVEAGTVRLVGTDEERIVREAARLLDDPQAYAAMSRAHNPYGDGRAAGRIVRVIQQQEEPSLGPCGSEPARAR
ncbi:non-hydrolyzing UDP-N-acetylglucosamine 2-epimerase [Thioalkalivibrio paradoxus]|uniref:UDP-N-acetylglucosamine 2-epimerase n=1 Tax=Thioalkalivibrio paradoxus ARh 1 TaxID=713585 RepID=W0DLS6_9GAMM|nr:UDP-N-acetylglucosamine 2-epimerase (non-hydrolyzing) [Thioalkalivibrio paradoxus]AHE97835.1 UDP-N-acetylglucosamine 2-epimerase [Thioalkalivibrio paradoxus ARh 1]